MQIKHARTLVVQDCVEVAPNEQMLSSSIAQLNDCEDVGKRGAGLARRNSVFDKLVTDHTRKYVSSVRFRALGAVALLGLLVLVAGSRQAYDEMCLLLNRVWVKLPGSEGHPVELPSLNLFDYEAKVSFPVFKDKYPEGLRREQMPQLPARQSANTSKEGKGGKVGGQLFWARFENTVRQAGGRFSREEVDLRFTRPLQREISGLIVYNVLFHDIKEIIKRDPNMFRDHIVLVETPEEMVGRMGERIPAGTLFNLDGHHTNQVLKLCAKVMHPNLRRGNINMENHVCGSDFSTRQKPLIIKGVNPLEAISLALEAGADSGHGMTVVKS